MYTDGLKKAALLALLLSSAKSSPLEESGDDEITTDSPISTKTSTVATTTTSSTLSVPSRFEVLEAANQLLFELQIKGRVVDFKIIKDKDFVSGDKCRPGKIAGKFGMMVKRGKKSKPVIWWLGDAKDAKELFVFLRKGFNKGLSRPTPANQLDLDLIENYLTHTKLKLHQANCGVKDLKRGKEMDISPKRRSAERSALTYRFDSQFKASKQADKARSQKPKLRP